MPGNPWGDFVLFFIKGCNFKWQFPLGFRQTNGYENAAKRWNACNFRKKTRLKGSPIKFIHGQRTPREEIAFTARPKIHSHSQIFRYGRSIFCLPHWPNFSDIFDLCLHWLSVVRDRCKYHPKSTLWENRWKWAKRKNGSTSNVSS